MRFRLSARDSRRATLISLRTEGEYPAAWSAEESSRLWACYLSGKLFNRGLLVSFGAYDDSGRTVKVWVIYISDMTQPGCH